MVSHPNAQLIRDAYEAIGRGDIQPMLATLSDDATWTDSTLGPLAGTYRKDAIPQFFAGMADIYGGALRVEIAAMIADDDRCVVLTQESGTVDGQSVAWTGAHIYTFAAGRVTSFVSYNSAEYQRFWANHADLAPTGDAIRRCRFR